MAKKLLQDIISKKSIHDISRDHMSHSTQQKISKREEREEYEEQNHISHNHKNDAHSHSEHSTRAIKEESEPNPYHREIDIENLEDGYFSSIGRKNMKTVWLWVAGCLVALSAFIALASFFDKASLSVSVHALDTTVGSLFVASSDSTSSGALTYQSFEASKELQVTVPGNTDQTISKKATGTVIIYNNYGTASQKLIKNTRLESPAGKIYRITDSVTVPGKTIKAGKTTPGSATVTVIADAAGADYNSDVTDFTIPGFKGDPRFNAFYGRSKTALAGGYEGIVKVVSQKDIDDAKTKMNSDLRDTLVKQALTQIPNDSILYKNAYTVTFETLSEAPSDKGTTVHQKATLKAILFKRSDVSKAIASLSTAGTLKDATYTVTNLDDLVFAFSSKDPFSAEAKDIAFTLTGNAHLVADLNTKAFASDARGIQKSNISSLLIKYPGAQAIDVSIRPFWKSVIPDTVSKIEVTVKEGK